MYDNDGTELFNQGWNYLDPHQYIFNAVMTFIGGYVDRWLCQRIKW